MLHIGATPSRWAAWAEVEAQGQPVSTWSQVSKYWALIGWDWSCDRNTGLALVNPCQSTSIYGHWLVETDLPLVFLKILYCSRLWGSGLWWQWRLSFQSVQKGRNAARYHLLCKCQERILTLNTLRLWLLDGLHQLLFSSRAGAAGSILQRQNCSHLSGSQNPFLVKY